MFCLVQFYGHHLEPGRKQKSIDQYFVNTNLVH